MTNGEDPSDDAVVRKLYHPNLRLLLVTEGPKGCRYYTKVRPIYNISVSCSKNRINFLGSFYMLHSLDKYTFFCLFLHSVHLCMCFCNDVIKPIGIQLFRMFLMQ